MINYNLLSPYTIQKMLKAVDILKNLQALVGETSEIYYYQNTRIKGSSPRNALNFYGMAINKFFGNSLIKRFGRYDLLFYGRGLGAIASLRNPKAPENGWTWRA